MRNHLSDVGSSPCILILKSLQLYSALMLRSKQIFSRHRQLIKSQVTVGKYQVLGTARWESILQHVIQGQIVPLYILHHHLEAVLPGKIKYLMILL